ncbi:amidohydrolase family protein, partial [Methanobrevibacter sp. OttesenSCG-928-I08]|nr:amidohydrolase family protein [Methanobrevibacter sp. OttesenSCG-928-I08]
KIINISKDALEGEIINVNNSIICPSFLNAHTHIGDSIIKDEGYGLSFDEIVKPPYGLKHIALENASKEHIINSMKVSMWNMLNSGTTHFIDYREGGIEGIKLLKEAAENIPISPIILGRDDIFFEEEPDLNKAKRTIRNILKIADGIAPSGFGEITEEIAILISEECEKQNKISSIHVAESKDSQDKAIEKYGKSEIQIGLDYKFNQLVHCTNPLEEDISSINNNVNITVCPRANALLGVGIPHLNEMVSKNLSINIGTDNLMLNSPNMMRELEFTFKLMQTYSNPVNPKDILKIATIPQNLNINKQCIEENNFAQFFITKNFSKNPYLSIINRTETKDIINIINRDKIINI